MCQTTYLLNAVLDDISNDCCILQLSKANRTANGLVFHSWIPLRLEDVNARGGGDVEPASLSANTPSTLEHDMRYPPQCTCAHGHQQSRVGLIVYKLAKDSRSL